MSGKTQMNRFVYNNLKKNTKSVFLYILILSQIIMNHIIKLNCLGDVGGVDDVKFIIVKWEFVEMCEFFYILFVFKK